MAKGRFITFEGGEGVGKSTQIDLLSRHLAARNVPVLVTREPGGSPLAEAIRGLLLNDRSERVPLAEALLFYAARADHLETAIRPALRKGTWVLCDRFSDSTRAYQGAASGVNIELLSRLERMVVGTTRPDLTLVLDIDPEIGLARADVRRRAGGVEAQDAFEGRDRKFHDRLRRAFLDIARGDPDRCMVVDASASLDVVEAEIWTHVRERLKL